MEGSYIVATEFSSCNSVATIIANSAVYLTKSEDAHKSGQLSVFSLFVSHTIPTFDTINEKFRIFCHQ